jgi:hypothetical protein
MAGCCTFGSVSAHQSPKLTKRQTEYEATRAKNQSQKEGKDKEEGLAVLLALQHGSVP